MTVAKFRKMMEYAKSVVGGYDDIDSLAYDIACNSPAGDFHRLLRDHDSEVWDIAYTVFSQKK